MYPTPNRVGSASGAIRIVGVSFGVRVWNGTRPCRQLAVNDENVIGPTLRWDKLPERPHYTWMMPTLLFALPRVIITSQTQIKASWFCSL